MKPLELIIAGALAAGSIAFATHWYGNRPSVQIQEAQKKLTEKQEEYTMDAAGQTWKFEDQKTYQRFNQAVQKAGFNPIFISDDQKQQVLILADRMTDETPYEITLDETEGFEHALETGTIYNKYGDLYLKE